MYNFSMEFAARGVKDVVTIFLESSSASALSWLELGLLRPVEKRLRCGVYESMDECLVTCLGGVHSGYFFPFLLGCVLQ